MRSMHRIAVALALVLNLVHAGAAQAAEIRVFCTTALRTFMQDLIPEFERTTGHTINIEYGVAVQLQRRIEAGEPFDVAMLTGNQFEALIPKGKIVVDSRTAIARLGMALAIHKGGRRYDISTVDALKRTLLETKSIVYAPEGASGIYFVALAKKLGIADALTAKSKLVQTGDQLAVLPVSEILPFPNAEVLGPFPAAVQEYSTLFGGVNVAAKQPGPSRELLRFVLLPAALPVIKKRGLDPPQ
jgi:molybdate transport system substrate-binding protein